MDFAFAPGRTGYDAFMRQLFTNRPNTTLVQGRTLRTVADFFTQLHTTGTNLPADDLYIVSHGNDHAWMQIQLDTTQNGATTFEAADAAINGHSDPHGTGVTAGGVEIPNNVNHDSGGNLGLDGHQLPGLPDRAAERFVDRLKEAFGNESPVTAPKHFHDIVNMGSVGMMEYLS